MTAVPGVGRLFAAGGPGLAEHLSAHGAAPARPRGWLAAEVTAAGLTGRGGAGYPTGAKIAAVATAGGRAAVVANGMEGEPASRKDATLLTQAPHLVLDGIALAAAELGADRAVLAVKRGGPYAAAQAEVLTAALAQRRDPVPVELAWGGHAYVASQETALLRGLSGQRPVPGLVPPHPAQAGLGGRPTLASNVETYAHLALIARHGGGWFRSVGTASAPGTFVLTVTGAVRHPGVVEVPGGTRLTSVIEAVGGAPGGVAAVLLGGYFGRWVGRAQVGRSVVDPLALREQGASLGAGVVIVLPDDACGLVESARVTRWLAGESAGQCGPCRLGLPALAEGMEAIAAGRADAALVRRVVRWTGDLLGRGACHHPDGVAAFVASALQAFAEELDVHLRSRRCRASSTTVVCPLPAALHGTG